MGINNINVIKNLMYFTHPNDYYLIQAIRRSKDTGEKVRVIKTYYVKSFEEFDLVIAELKLLCPVFKCRAYIQLNKCNSETLCFESIKYLTQLIQDGNTRNFAKTFSSLSAKAHCDYWLIDVDNKDSEYISKLCSLIKRCRSKKGNDYIKELPTLNGVHLIVNPFDLEQFYQLLALEKLDKVDIHKQAMTLLYCE